MASVIEKDINDCFDEWKKVDENIVDSLLNAKRSQLEKVASTVRSDTKAANLWKTCFNNDDWSAQNNTLLGGTLNNSLNYSRLRKNFGALSQEELVYFVLKLEDNLLLKGSGIWSVTKANNLTNLIK